MLSWKTSPLTKQEVKTIIAKLKSKATDEVVYWEIYDIFHDSKRAGGAAVIEIEDYVCTMDYREDDFELYSLIDDDKNAQFDAYTREQFLALMSKHVKDK